MMKKRKKKRKRNKERKGNEYRRNQKTDIYTYTYIDR